MTLYPGPDTPDGPTWFCTTADVPRGWNWRTHTTHEWKDRPLGVAGLSGEGWVQVRRVDPQGHEHVMVLQDDNHLPVTFDQIDTVIDAAMGEQDPIRASHPIALAVWWLLVMGEERDAG